MTDQCETFGSRSIGMKSCSLRLLLGAVFFGALSLSVLWWHEAERTCEPQRLVGVYGISSDSQEIVLRLFANGTARLEYSNPPSDAETTWEFDGESQNIFLKLRASEVKQLRRLGKLDDSSSEFLSALFGLNPTCTFGRPRLYLNRDLGIFFEAR